MRAVAILLAAVVCSGCATAATSSRVAETLESTLPECRLERDSTMVLGRASLALLRGLSGIPADGGHRRLRNYRRPGRGVARFEAVVKQQRASTKDVHPGFTASDEHVAA